MLSFGRPGTWRRKSPTAFRPRGKCPHTEAQREGGIHPSFPPGVGFPLHHFVCGLMFYYELDFHDLSPNSFLNISAFIVVCEAFLRIQPHFGLWLKVFNVKPKVVDGQHAECGGAMVSKLSNVS